MPREVEVERNAEIWRRFCAGERQAAIAKSYGISQQTVSEICQRKRIALGPIDRDKKRQELASQLDYLRAQMAELVEREPAPMYRGAEPVRDDDGNVVEDHSGRIAATDALLRVQARAAKLLGLDAPDKVETAATVRYVVDNVDLDELK